VDTSGTDSDASSGVERHVIDPAYIIYSPQHDAETMMGLG
jgi:hypothetical protein